LDAVDKKIMALLRTDSRTPYTNMAKTLDISEGTVRRRIQTLVQSGIIKRFTVEARDERPKALVLISIAPSIPTSQIAKQISNFGGVTSLFEVAGPYDITLTVSGDNIPSINQRIDEIRSVKGVQQTTTLFVLKEWADLPL
jgi:Lrp/AsnC family transcriptional regulator for asnA, asnC and gidA